MTRKEHYGLLLNVEYNFYWMYLRWLQEGRLSDHAFTIKENRQYKAIMHLKNSCEAELLPEEYPEAYYYPDPDTAEQLLSDQKSELPDTDLSKATVQFPDSSDDITEYHQLSIFDIGIY